MSMSFDVKHIKDKNGYLVFFKIIENEYVDSLTKNGQIYFSLLSTYREMEKQGKTAIGDKAECSLTHKISEYIIFEDEAYEIHGKNSGYNVRIENNQCAFCFYALEMKDYDKIDENKIRHVIPHSVLEKMCKDKGGVSNCSIVVFDDQVIHKIYSALCKKQIKHGGKSVEYDNFDYIPKYDINSVQYSVEAAFHKLENYSYQHEFRIVAINHCSEPINDLYIDVVENDFGVVKLRENMDFYNEITYNAVCEEGKRAIVELKSWSFLNDINDISAG